MRVAALYDVHGNLPALEAVLADVAARETSTRSSSAATSSGGRSRSSASTLLRDGGRDASCAGNCERDVLQPTSDVDRWCSERLDRRDARVRRGVAADGRARGRRRSAASSSVTRRPARRRGILTRAHARRGRRARRSRASTRTSSSAGHTHVQFDRAVAGAPRLVNAGSVGLPYEGAPGRVLGAARRRTSSCAATDYDVERGARASSGAPGSRRSTTSSPSRCAGRRRAEEATAHFESRRGA